jgi:hypothetical protein
MNSPNHTRLEGYEVGRLLWLVYFKQSTWSWLDVENLQRWRRSAVTGKKSFAWLLHLFQFGFSLLIPIPIFTLVCAHLTWLANKYSSNMNSGPYPYLQLKKARKDGQSGRHSVKQATTQCCPRTRIERKLPVPWCQITKATPTALLFLFWRLF